MNSHEDKLFAVTLLVAFAGSLLAALGIGASTRQSIAQARTPRVEVVQPCNEVWADPALARSSFADGCVHARANP